MAIDVTQVLSNLLNTYPYLWHMVTAIAFVSGFVFALKAIYAFKIYGEMRTMMNPQTNLRLPLTYLLIAMVLIYTPSGLHMAMETLYGYSAPKPLQYDPSSAVEISQAIHLVLALVQLVGIIAFVRGWFFLAKGGQQGAQQGIGKAITHIIGGIMAVNIVGTYEVFANTLGLPALQF